MDIWQIQTKCDSYANVIGMNNTSLGLSVHTVKQVLAF